MLRKIEIDDRESFLFPNSTTAKKRSVDHHHPTSLDPFPQSLTDRIATIPSGFTNHRFDLHHDTWKLDLNQEGEASQSLGSSSTMSQQSQQRAPTVPSQSSTITETSTESQGGAGGPPPQPSRILRLRGARTSADRSVQWAEDVVDNEGLGRKSSKVCCIYHRPKAVDESSDESSSSDSDVSSDDDRDADRKGKNRACGHGPGHSHDGERSRRTQRGEDGGETQRKPSPNAYERVPKPKPKESKPDALSKT